MGKNWKSYAAAGLIAIAAGLEAFGLVGYSKIVLMIGGALGLTGVAHKLNRIIRKDVS